MNNPKRINFLYRIEAGSQTYLLTDVAEDQLHDGETYAFTPIEHTTPTYSADAQDAEIDITLIESHPIAGIFINGPPAYPVIVTIYEYDREAGTADPYYRGWVVRPDFELDESKVSLHCKSLWHFFERESFTDSLAALSRYSVYDLRAGVDIEAFRVGVTITAINDERDVLTVTGITEIDDYFTAGLIIAPDRDMRTILKHTGGMLTLNAAFPRFTLAIGFTADIYPGDDLTYATWANKFAGVTNNGEAHGGWPFMPNVDPAVRGVI